MNTDAATQPGTLAIAPLNDAGILSIDGDDTVAFLQGQVTCDVKALRPGDISLGALCSPKGRVVTVFRLLRTETGCLLILPANMLDAARRRLKPYVLRSRVRISDAAHSGDWRLTGLLGFIRPGTPLGIATRPEPGHAVRTPVGAWLLGLDRTGKFLVAGTPAQTEALSGALVAGGSAEPVPPDRWHAADIADGIPSITPATTEEFLPQMLNLDVLGGVSFSKGCYTGQEVVARTHYLGAVKRRMYRLITWCDDRPEPGTRLASLPDDTTAGHVLIAAPIPQDPRRHDLLAVLTSEGAQADTLYLGSSAGPKVAQASLPYAVDC